MDGWFSERGFGLVLTLEDNEYWSHLFPKQTLQVHAHRYGRGPSPEAAAHMLGAESKRKANLLSLTADCPRRLRLNRLRPQRETAITNKAIDAPTAAMTRTINTANQFFWLVLLVSLSTAEGYLAKQARLRRNQRWMDYLENASDLS